MLPKFLIADNSQESSEKVYVVHTQAPRCIIESDLDDFTSGQKIHWIDNKISGDALDDFLEKAEEFFEKELDSQEYLFDEEFDDE